MPYIFTFPISRKEYVKEKYLLGAGDGHGIVGCCCCNCNWCKCFRISYGVLGRTDRFCSCRSFSCCFRKCGCVSGTVEIWKLYRKAGATCSCIWHHGCRMDWRRTMPENESGFFRSRKNLGLRIWNLGIPVCLAMLFVLMLLMLLISCTISIKIMEKGVLIRK